MQPDIIECKTSKFGLINIRSDRVITFEKGLIGFPEAKKFFLLEPGADCAFFWMQSLDNESLAFVITDPTIFLPEYSVMIESEDLKQIDLKDLSDAQTFVVVNKVDSNITGNLLSPLVINTKNFQGFQSIHSSNRWGVKEVLFDLNKIKTRV